MFWDTPEQSCVVPELGHSDVYHLLNFVRYGYTVLYVVEIS